MWKFFRYLGNVAARSALNLVIGGVLIAIGFTHEQIAKWMLGTLPTWVSYWQSHLVIQLVFIISAFLVMAFGFYRRELQLEGDRVRRDEVSINGALNYFVNDSNWKAFQIPQTAKPHREGYTFSEYPQGWQHSAALTELGEKIAAGVIPVWGYREFMPPTSRSTFDHICRKIDREYWEYAYLHPLHCFSQTRTVEQTAFVNFNPQTHPHYTGLTVRLTHLATVWPRRSVFQRIWNRYIRRKPRLTYWAVQQN